MINPHCKIGKIRMHAGGAEIRILTPADDRCMEIRKLMIERAAGAADRYEAIAGYALMAWHHDGRCVTSYEIHPHSKVDVYGLPDYAAAQFRAVVGDLVSNDAIDNRFCVDDDDEGA